MTPLSQFLDNVKVGLLSDCAPIETENPDNYLGDSLSLFKARDECNKMGMWAIVDLNWTNQLATWIKRRKCLEVMSGAGWLAKALRYYGVNLVATDNYSWKNKQHKDMNIVSVVEEIDGLEAVRKYKDKEILVVSWPPYDKNEICSICEEWGDDKPIVYIGELEGGCCAPESFWKNFKEIENDLDIKIPQWWGIHDYLTIGNWTSAKIKSKNVNNAIELLEIEDVS